MATSQPQPNINEDMYREIVQDESLKAGTYYERLIAIVQKILNNTAVVIHDIRLVGEDTGEKHQVDVTIEKNGVKKHVLFECKDFSDRNEYNKVGIGVIRGFFGLCDDVKPDLAAVVSCTGFSKPAIGYALKKPFDKDKYIQLITIRDFREEDWENRVRTIVLRFHIKQQKIPKVRIEIDKGRLTPAIEQVLPALVKDMVIVPSKQVLESSAWPHSTTLQDRLTEDIKKIPFAEVKAEGTIEFPEDCILIYLGHRLPVKRCDWQFEFETSIRDVMIGAEKIAKLLVEFVTEDKSDSVIWEDELTKWRIDPETGEVVPK